MKQAFIYGIAYGVSQAMIPFMFALCFGFGGYLSVCECLPWRSQKIPFFYIFRWAPFARGNSDLQHFV